MISSYQSSMHLICICTFFVRTFLNFQRHYTDDDILGAICGSIYATAILVLTE